MFDVVPPPADLGARLRPTAASEMEAAGSVRLRPQRSRRSVWVAMIATISAVAVLLATCGDMITAFVGKGALQPKPLPRVAMHARGKLVPSSVAKEQPENFKRQFMKRMPDSNLSLEEMMQRITTVLIKNVEEKWRDAPMKTLDIMKEIGCRGNQIKTKKHINKALYMLFSQKVIYKVKQNPIRWEIHEDYRKDGLPVISGDKRRPWRFAHLLKFKQTKAPKYGPIHGEYRPNIKLGRNPVDKYGQYKYLPEEMAPYVPAWEREIPEKKLPGA